MQSQNTFFKGLNQDNSRSKYENSSYFDALNIRVTTDTGLTSLSVENEKGNKLIFTFPDIPENFKNVDVYKDGTARQTPYVQGSDLKIIGYSLSNEYIVIFTGTSQDEKPIDGYGQIWVIKFDNNLENIENSFDTVLSLDDLKYNDKLNLSTAHRIESLSIIENEKLFNSYFTDNYNNFKSINLSNSFEEIALLKPSMLEMSQDASLTIPIIKDIVAGSLSTGTVVQIAYRLVNKVSGGSVYSYATQPVTLSDFNYKSSAEARQMKGNAYKEIGDKGVEYEIIGIDTNYDLLEHVAIIYPTKDSPTIFKFKEELINGRTTIKNTLGGSETRILLDSVIFNTVKFGFDVCKTIDTVSNVLVAGNVKIKSREISNDLFDSRAYRFNSGVNNTALLTDKNSNITLNGNNPTFDYVPEDHDCINPFNVQKGVNETINNYDLYKYQQNGSTLGGSGKYISYRFVNESLNGNNNPGANNHINVEKSQPTFNLGVKDFDNNTIAFQGQPQYKTFVSPLIQHYFTGYMRGEVYRFGIKFIDKKGQPYFVKWVGDIKFPEQDDNFTVQQNITETNIGLNSLGIEFNVKIPPQLKNIISGYKIVRLKRTSSDESRLGTAPIVLWSKGFGPSIDLDNPEKQANLPVWQINQSTTNGGNDIISSGLGSGVFNLNCRPYTRYVSLDQVPETSMSHLMWFSPLLLYGKYHNSGNFINNKQEDFLKTTGFVDAVLTEYRGLGPTARAYFNMNKYFLRRRFNVEARISDSQNTTTEETYLIKDLFFKDSSRVKNGIFQSGIEDFENIPVYSDANDKNPNSLEYLDTVKGKVFCKNFNAGIANNTVAVANNPNLIATENNPNHTVIDEHAFNNWDVNEPNTVIANDSPLEVTGFRFKEMSYCRKLSDQYNGNNFEARSNQFYISTGHFQIINDVVFDGNLSLDNCEITSKVFGGDTYVNYTAHEYLMPSLGSTKQFDYRFMFDNINNNFIVNNIDEKNKIGMSVALVYATESTINTDLNTGEFQFKSDRFGFSDEIGDFNIQFRLTAQQAGSTNIFVNGGDSILKNDFVLNENYLQENNITTKLVSKDFFNLFVEEFKYRLWASERKIIGELFDAYREFKDFQNIDVDGEYGEIVKVINFRDRIIYLQERGIGTVNLNERSMLTDTNGSELVVGSAQTTLNYFKYISNNSGTKHQFSVVVGNGLYYYDSLNNKIKILNEGLEELTTVKGMQSWLINNVANSTRLIDKTLNNTGVHFVSDKRHNRLFFTFLQENNNQTLSFSEKINAFESRYSFTPNMYITIDNILISTKNNNGTSFIHDKGNYGQFYGENVNESFITVLFNDKPEFVKVFDNILYNTEIKDVNGIDISNETLSNINIYNDYQDTGNIQLVVNDNVKRRLRSWRYAIPRNQGTLERMRDYYVFGKFSFDNTNNRRLVLHDIIMFYRPSIL